MLRTILWMISKPISSWWQSSEHKAARDWGNFSYMAMLTPSSSHFLPILHKTSSDLFQFSSVCWKMWLPRDVFTLRCLMFMLFLLKMIVHNDGDEISRSPWRTGYRVRLAIGRSLIWSQLWERSLGLPHRHQRNGSRAFHISLGLLCNRALIVVFFKYQ